MDGHIKDVKRMTLLPARVGNDPLIHGTAARSSDEAPVMGVERRGIVSADSYVDMVVEEAVGIPD